MLSVDSGHVECGPAEGMADVGIGLEGGGSVQGRFEVGDVAGLDGAKVPDLLVRGVQRNLSW